MLKRNYGHYKFIQECLSCLISNTYIQWSSRYVRYWYSKKADLRYRDNKDLLQEVATDR